MPQSQNQEKRFRDAYAKELAKALLENERKQRRQMEEINDSSPHVQDLFSNEDIENCYLSLCYDNPHLNDDALCKHLSYAILASFSPWRTEQSNDNVSKRAQDLMSRLSQKMTMTRLGLCDRFIHGILEITASHAHDDTPDIHADVSKLTSMKTEDYTMPYNGESLITSGSQRASSRNSSQLALACFVLGPLYCCDILLYKQQQGQQNLHNLDDVDESTVKGYTAIRNFLGSYGGQPPNNPERALDGDDVVSSETFLQNLVPNGDGVHDTISNHPVACTDERKESASQQMSDLVIQDTDEDSMKEIYAAESDPDDFDYGNERYTQTAPPESDHYELKTLLETWDARILSQPKMLNLEEMKHRVESLLSQLTSSRINLGRKAWKEWDTGNQLVSLTLKLLCFLGHEQFDSLGRKYIRPLTVLRDYSVDLTHTCDAMDCYLNLIRTLLRSEAVIVGDYASKDRPEEMELSPARTIGLCSLADLCSNQNVVRSSPKTGVKTRIKRVVMECVDDIVECVEFLRPNADPSKVFHSSSSWLRLSMVLSKIIDFMTGIPSVSENSSRTSCSVEESLTTTSEEAQMFLQSGLFRELIFLYVRSQSSIGITEHAQDESTSIPFVRQQLLRSILVLSSQSVVLRKYIARVPEFTNIVYSENFDGINIVDAIVWHALLGCVTSSNNVPTLRMKGIVTIPFVELKKRCRNNFLQLCSKVIEAMDDISFDSSIIHDFLMLCHYCHQLPFIAECWSSAMRIEGESHSTTNAINDFLKVIPKGNIEPKPKGENKSLLQDKLPEERIDTRTSSLVRKGCKELLFLLENHDQTTTTLSSKLD